MAAPSLGLYTHILKSRWLSSAIVYAWVELSRILVPFVIGSDDREESFSLGIISKIVEDIGRRRSVC